MTILDILNKAAGAEHDIVAALKALAEKAPDLAPAVADIVAKLDAAVDPANLAALGATIPGELLAISQGKLTPTTHAGDAA